METTLLIPEARETSGIVVTAATTRFSNGVEVDGNCHLDNILSAAEAWSISDDEVCNLVTEEGFRLSTGRFVEREEACGIAKRAGQYQKGPGEPETPFLDYANVLNDPMFTGTTQFRVSQSRHPAPPTKKNQ